jgi:hypothetical protein
MYDVWSSFDSVTLDDGGHGNGGLASRGLSRTTLLNPEKGDV